MLECVVTVHGVVAAIGVIVMMMVMMITNATTQRIGCVHDIAADADHIDGALFADHRTGFIIHQNDNHRVVVIVLANRMSSVRRRGIAVHMCGTTEGRRH